MSQVSPRVGRANRTAAGDVDGRRVILIFSVSYHNVAFFCEQPAVSGVTSRHNTIKQIDAECDAFRQVRRWADTHQETWFFLWHIGLEPVNDLIHQRFGLANSQTADCITLKIHADKP